MVKMVPVNVFEDGLRDLWGVRVLDLRTQGCSEFGGADFVVQVGKER